VIENAQMPRGAHNMGLDPTNLRAFIVSARFGPVRAEAAGRRRGSMIPGSLTLMVIERDPSTP
jgi:hypothetical protein